MRTRLDDLVNEARAEGRGVPAITAYSFATAAAIVDGAEQAGKGLGLLVPPTRFAARDGVRFMRALRALADDAAVPVSIQFDHATDAAQIVDAVAAGADAVLADGSKLSLEENARFVEHVRTLVPDAVIEAELGAIPGDEDRSVGAGAAHGAFTDPASIAAFLDASHADLLAVSVGNVHGAYRGTPHLEWELIERIAAETTVPLAMHGASGIPEADLRRAISQGFGKVNVNTELRRVLLDGLEADLPGWRADGDNVLALETTQYERVAGFTIALLGSLSAG